MPLRLLLLLTLPLVLLAPRAGWADELPRPGGNAATLLSGPAVEPEFLPVEQAYPLRAELLDARLRFTWDILPGYYLYRSRMGLANATSGAREPVPVDWPAGIPHEDEFFGATEIYREHLVVEIPLPASGALELLLSSQGCADAGLCYPPRTQRFRIDPVAGTVSELAPEEQAAPRAPASAPVLAGTGQSLPLMALFAFLGGLILNLMPCVFPVLSLKVLGIAQKGGGQGTALGHGLAYSAGVVLSFLAVAALLIGLRGAGAAIGWGFHLQSPVFVASLAYLFVAMGLGLSGVANLGAGLMGVGSSIAARAGLAGSFFTGVLAAVVASPCSAPFMGTALGFAMTQSAAVALGIFAALGLGMAAPFLLLSLSPGLLRRLPRPGAWMEGFKQFLAFPLYAAAVWLLWVLGKQGGVDAMAAVLGGAVLVGAAMWCWESARNSGRALAWRTLAAGCLALAIGILGSPLLQARGTAPAALAEGWEPYTPERLATLRREGAAVFVNVTADWCITCLANEKVALETEAVRSAFRERGVVYLKGDWTNADPVLTAFLAEHGRNGVPLYLFYPPRIGALPVVLPQLLTPGTVIDTLSK